MLQNLISGKYKLSDKLAITPFFEIFRGVHHHNLTEVAIKIEKKSISHSELLNQVKIIKDIQGEDLTADFGIPHIVQNGTEGSFNYLVMDLLGPSLDKVLVEKQGRFDLKLVLDLGQQMIERIEMTHSRGYIHRDLRPQHFLYGRAKRPNKVYLTGFTMSKKYLRIDKKHVDYKDNRHSFTGTARFLSLNAHFGIEQSRRDDIESILYILIYFLKGSLPWQGLKARTKSDKFDKIMDVKLETPIQELCQGLPSFLKELLLYTRVLEYEDIPDYQFLRKTLRSFSEKEGQEIVLQI